MLTGSLLRDWNCLSYFLPLKNSPLHIIVFFGGGIQEGNTITVNRFFLHSSLPEARLALFTVAYKVLILLLLTVAYEDSVYHRLVPDCSFHVMRFSIFFLTTSVPQERPKWSLLNGMISLCKNERFFFFIKKLKPELVMAQLKQYLKCNKVS